jgi:histidine ammonia-lyase
MHPAGAWSNQDSLVYVLSVFLTEINSVTDNPNIFPEEDLILAVEIFMGTARA